MNTNCIRRHVSGLIVLWMVSTLVMGCASRAPAATPLPGVTPVADSTTEYWPTQGWRESTPEAQGMDSRALAAMLDAVKAKSLDLHSLLVIRNGYIVSETYFPSFRPDTRHELYSCTKSFISTLVGIAMDKRYIDAVSRPVADFFPGRSFENRDADKQAMTLENLLTMTSGLNWAEGDPIYRQMYVSRDWVKFVMDMPMREPPGTKFNYCSGCSHVLSAIVRAKTGKNTCEFARQELFDPLGISNFAWDTDATGIPIGGWGLQITPRDMAKLGYLYLHQGRWDGRQIVSTAWVKIATQKHTGTDSQLGYGYQWWIYPAHGAYTALGRGGQTIFVVPDLDLIVVTTAALGGHDEIFQLIDKYIVPAARKSS